MSAFVSRLRPVTLGLPIALALGIWAALVALAPTVSLKAILLFPVLIIPLVWWSLVNTGLWLKLFFISAILLPPIPLLVGERNLHPSIVFAVLGCFVGLLQLRRWPVRCPRLAAGFVGFLSVLLASLIAAVIYSGLEIASASFARVLLFAIGPYTFFYVLLNERAVPSSDTLRFARLLFFIAVIAALFACCDFYFQFPAPTGFGPQFVWLDEGVFRRAQGLFYEASTLGNFCVFFLVMIAVTLFQPSSQRICSLVWLVLGGAALGTALIFSYSRGSLLNLMISVAVLACLKASGVRRRLLLLTAGAAVCALIVYFVFPSFSQSYWSRLSASVQYFWESPEGVLSGRISNWTALVHFITREPWNILFGIGYKTLPYSDYLGSTLIGDNTYLTLLIETGVVGLSAFLFLNYQVLRNALQAARSKHTTTQFFGAWIFCFWIGELVQMSSGDLITYWRVLPIYFAVLAVAVRESKTA